MSKKSSKTENSTPTAKTWIEVVSPPAEKRVAKIVAMPHCQWHGLPKMKRNANLDRRTGPKSSKNGFLIALESLCMRQSISPSETSTRRMQLNAVTVAALSPTLAKTTLSTQLRISFHLTVSCMYWTVVTRRDITGTIQSAFITRTKRGRRSASSASMLNVTLYHIYWWIHSITSSNTKRLANTTQCWPSKNESFSAPKHS